MLAGMTLGMLASFPGSRAGEEEREPGHTVRACAKFTW